MFFIYRLQHYTTTALALNIRSHRLTLDEEQCNEELRVRKSALKSAGLYRPRVPFGSLVAAPAGALGADADRDIDRHACHQGVPSGPPVVPTAATQGRQVREAGRTVPERAASGLYCVVLSDG